MNIEQKKEEYKDDEEISKFLTSDKSDEYKCLIISLLETDYSRFTYSESNKKVIKQRNDNHRESHKEVIRRYKTDYRESNKDDIKQQRADYYESNKDAIKQRQADYRESNKDAIKQQRADYYKSNKEAIKQRQADYRESIKQSKKYYCDICEIVCTYNKELQQHLKTSKHLRNKSRT